MFFLANSSIIFVVVNFNKRLFFFVLVLLFSTSFISALSSKPFALNIALGSSAIVYGDEQIKEYKSVLFAENTSRFILNTEVSTHLFLDDYISLNIGSILGFDWFKNTNANLFLLKYDIFAGIRIYPFLNGFNFGIDYICGGLSNFLKVYSTSDENIKSATVVSDWSNGFRLLAEYIFVVESSKYSPAIGCYWQNMPRNNGYDNSFSVYAKLAIR